MAKLKLGQCQVEGCGSEAKYKLFRTLKDKKEWLSVCPLHEGHIGNENIERWELAHAKDK